MLEVLKTDKAFTTSPDAGHKDCLCSRCGARICEAECPIRMWTQNEQGEVDENSLEYRYCPKCLGVTGITLYPVHAEDEHDPEMCDPIPDRVCRVCGCHEYDACIHPVQGACYWVEFDLCSHCAIWPGESKRYSEIENSN